MKILMVMCDMVRPGVFNMNYSNNKLLDLMKSIGGVYYNNCFTPGPDTGRSLACVWSGKIPKQNGCISRSNYPKFYLKSKTFLDILDEYHYTFNFFTNPNEKILGVLPSGYENKGYHNTTLNLKEYVSNINFSYDNVFTYIDLTDFHWAIDDYGANDWGVKEGIRHICESINILIEEGKLYSYDYVFIFSDHGFKFRNEYLYQSKLMMLNSDRTNTLLFIHKKGCADFTLNDKLCSTIDFYPTIMNILNFEYVKECSGYSFFSNQEHEYIVSEEHENFYPEINQPICYWSINCKDFYYCCSVSDSILMKFNKSNRVSEQECQDILINNCSSYRESMRIKDILKLYSTMANDKSFYTNMEKRVKITKMQILNKVKQKFYDFISKR